MVEHYTPVSADLDQSIVFRHWLGPVWYRFWSSLAHLYHTTLSRPSSQSSHSTGHPLWKWNIFKQEGKFGYWNVDAAMPFTNFLWWSDATEALIYKITALLSLKENKTTPNEWEKPKSVTILTKKTLLTPLHPSTIFRYFFLIFARFFTWASLRVTRPSLIRSSRTVFPTMFRAGIGTGSWSRMESTAAGPGTFPPFGPLGPVPIDWNYFTNRLRIRSHNITR